MKQYFSPFTLLKITAGKTIERKDLMIAKRKMLAEFELQNTSSILLNEKEVSKNDILKIFDELDESDDLAYHAIVNNDADLLYFLEHNELLDKTISNDRLLANHSYNPIITEPFKIVTVPIPARFGLTEDVLTEDFINWISPYFAHSFKTASFNYYRKQNAAAFIALMENNRYMTSDDEFEAWEPVVNLVEIQNQKLDEIASSEYNKEHNDIVGELASNQQTLLLQKLPTNYFSHELDTYAVNMMRCSVDIFNKFDRKWALNILQNAKSLSIGDEAMKMVVDKENEMLGIIRGTPSSTKERKDPSNWIYRVGFFILFIILKAAFFSSNSNDKSKYDNFSYNDNSIYANRDFNKTAAQLNGIEQIDFLNKFMNCLATDSLHIITNLTSYHIKNGEDVFNKIWYQQKIKNDSTTTDSTLHKSVTKNTVTTDEEAATKQEYLSVTNNSELDVIVIISTENGVTSSFAKEKSTVTIPIKNGKSYVYFYAGKYFSLKNSLHVLTIDANDYYINGLFGKTYPANNKLLQTPITFAIDELTSTTKLENAAVNISSNQNQELTVNTKNGTNAKQVDY